MYSVKFISENGQSFLFDARVGVVADFDLASGMNTAIGTTQSFGQTGETIETKSVGSRQIAVKGVIFESIAQKKAKLRKVITPFTNGKLLFNDKYEISVAVEESPTFKPAKDDGTFTILFKAPYPFFKGKDTIIKLLGEITPQFKFPVNYATPHSFGVRAKGKTLKIVNDSDVKIPFAMHIVSSGATRNLTVSNLKTFKKLQINATITSGDVIQFYRDKDNFLHCELVSRGKTTDILDKITEDSDLFYLDAGDNLLSATDENGSENFTLYLVYREEVVNVFEY